MPNSKTDAAKSAPVVGEPAADAGTRAPGDSSAPVSAPVAMNGIIVSRLNLAVVVAVLAGAFTLVWERMSDLDTRVWDLHDQVAGLRVELHTEIDGLRQELRADIGDLREEVREIAALIRARDAEAQ